VPQCLGRRRLVPGQRLAGPVGVERQVGRVAGRIDLLDHALRGETLDDARGDARVGRELRQREAETAVFHQRLHHPLARGRHSVGLALAEAVDLAHRRRVAQARHARGEAQHLAQGRQRVGARADQELPHLLAHGGGVEHARDGSHLGGIEVALALSPDDAQHLAGAERHLDEGAQPAAPLRRAVVEHAVDGLGREHARQHAFLEIGPAHAFKPYRPCARRPPDDHGPRAKGTSTMKFFVDTADIDAIRDLAKLGIVDGVTTNPSLIMKSGRDIKEVTAEICELVDGPVSAETVALDAEGMIAEGKELARIADNIAIKVPLTWEGLKACNALTNEGFMVNVTLCFSANQALLAAKAGATFISPFIGRLDDINVDGMELISEIRQIYDNYSYDTEILAASIRTVNHIKQAALIGADVITAPPGVIHAMASHPLTDKGLEGFLKDWAKTGQKIL
jgi:transaldolase